MKWVNCNEKPPTIDAVVRKAGYTITMDRDSYLNLMRNGINPLDYEWLDESFERVFYIDEVRKMLIQLKNEDISLSKFVEVLNEKATGLTALEMYNLSKHS